MLLAETNVPILSLAIVVFLAGLIVVSATSGRAFNFEVTLDPSKSRAGAIAGSLAMLAGLALAVVAFVSDQDETATATATESTPPNTSTPSLSTTTTSSSSSATTNTSTPTVVTSVGPTAAATPPRTIGRDAMVVRATSVLATQSGCGDVCDYRPENLIDGDITTAWAEGVDGAGIGESVFITLDGEYELVGVRVAPGWQRDTCLYQKNGRPSGLLLTSNSGQSVAVSLEDLQGEQAFELDLVGSELEVTILDHWPGTACGGTGPFEDTLVSEIELTGIPTGA